MNKIKTSEVLIRFYGDCKNFWLREGEDDRQAKELALKDLERLKTNPYEPRGEELDAEAQGVVIETLRALV